MGWRTQPQFFILRLLYRRKAMRKKENLKSSLVHRPPCACPPRSVMRVSHT